MLIEIDDSKINDLQRATIRRLIDRCGHAHYTDVTLRINGGFENFEADWIKHMRVADQASGERNVP